MIERVTVFTTATPIHAIGVLRLLGPLGAAGITVDWQMADANFSLAGIADSDVVVVQRDFPRHFARYAQVVEAAARWQKPLIHELDDWLPELPDNHPDRAVHFYTPALFPFLVALHEADAVTVTTRELQAVVQAFNPRVYVLPNFLDSAIWPLRAPGALSTAGDGRQGVVEIGYIGGGSHAPDVAMLAPVLTSLLERFPGRVRLRFLGTRPPDTLLARPDVAWEPVHIEDYRQYAAWVRQHQLDVFIAPLTDTPFNRCKSPLKFLECSSLGIPGIFSAIPPFVGVVVHEQTGLLAGTLGAWEEDLMRLITRPGWRAQLATQAQVDIQENWLLSSQAHRWEEVYTDVKSLYRHDAGRAGRSQAYQGIAMALAEMAAKNSSPLIPVAEPDVLPEPPAEKKQMGFGLKRWLRGLLGQ